MEGRKSRPRAILVFGAPCSGKTTFAEKFAKRFDLAFFDFDAIKEENRLTRKNLLLFVSLLTRTGRTIYPFRLIYLGITIKAYYNVGICFLN